VDAQAGNWFGVAIAALALVGTIATAIVTGFVKVALSRNDARTAVLEHKLAACVESSTGCAAERARERKRNRRLARRVEQLERAAAAPKPRGPNKAK
jgi:hypothetical protein